MFKILNTPVGTLRAPGLRIPGVSIFFLEKLKFIIWNYGKILTAILRSGKKDYFFTHMNDDDVI